MKLFHQLALWVAVMFHLRSKPSIKRYPRWVSALALVLGVVVAATSPAATISPRRLMEVTDLGNPVISPDGRYVAFRAVRTSIERNTYDTTWYVQRLERRSLPHSVSDGGVPLREYVNGVVLASPAVWSPDSRWIYFRAHLKGRIAVWRAAANGSGSQLVTDDPADVRNFALSKDGQSLEYSVGATREQVLAAEQAQYDVGVHIDDKVVMSAGLLRSSRVEGRPSTQRFLGDWYSTGPLLAEVPDHWKVVDLTTMTTRDMPSSDVPVPSLQIADLPSTLSHPWKLTLNRDDGRIALLTHAGNGQGLSRKPDVELSMLPGKRSASPVKCLAELCTEKSISDIQWRLGSDEVLFTVRDYGRGEAQSIFAWNVISGKVRPIVVADGLLSGDSERDWGIPCAVSSATLVCVAAEADRPPHLDMVDLSTDERSVLFDPNKKLAEDIASTVPSKLIRWKDKLGREFTGFLFEARNIDANKPPPLFVNFYSCDGFLRGGVGNEWPLESLAEHGISALCINGLPGYHDFVQRIDQGQLAVEGVVKYLAAAGRINPSRVGMGGLSYGSEVTLWTAIHSNVLAVASVSTPVTDQTYYLFNSLRPGFRSGLKKMWQLGAPEETPKRWRTVSPTYSLDKIHIPILFQMAEQEYRVSLEYALPLVRRFQGDMYVFPDEAHIKFQPRHKVAVNVRNLDWFRFWLQGYEEPNPVKKQQYMRWREMREAMSTRPARSGARSGG
ncbi:dipeptidyl aminopeptidase [Rhodanobacter sp. B05]|uniref:Atxe2 family lasso peptide isopeptidase n=1 Tax=Rhodanobacter sp. B05 TaxID=1945859 RepID=UPI000985BAC4|nr:Atxe2 family lasso peptide isopeptidase [Rhodanobacter sp. B05]OOG57795.1 dipeptidyl aminopeptidase [Rhodanobacter sp. B05]